MDDVTKAMLLSVARSGLIALAGLAVHNGYISNDQATQVVGAAVIVLTAAWGALDKHLSEKKTQSREAVAMQAGMASVGATAPPPSITPQGTKP